jgi:hypothetical protein
MAERRASSTGAGDASPRRPSQGVRTSTAHLPINPSRLRETTILSPEERMARSKSTEEMGDGAGSTLPLPAINMDQNAPTVASPEPLPNEYRSSMPTQTYAEGQIEEPSDADARASLLGNYHHSRICGRGDCNHGTFSPRAPSLDSTRSADISFIGRYRDDVGEDESARYPAHGIFGDAASESFANNKSLNTTRWLAKRHGIRSRRWMYFSYYFPVVKWLPQYRWKWFQGDLVAALTMASFYIPMSLSYAANLAHVPPINGLYSFVFNPLIYALLGSCPQMVVGPEAAGSLLVGQVVKTCIDRGQAGDDDEQLNAQIGGLVTAIAGSVIFAAGLARLGFLDSVLSRPFLRGFISAIGFVIIVDQLIPELGLTEVARDADGVAHGSSAQKILFLVGNIGNSHRLTTAVSLGAFAIIMVFR